MQLPSRYRSIRPAHGSLAEALENRRRGGCGRLLRRLVPLLVFAERKRASKENHAPAGCSGIVTVLYGGKFPVMRFA